MLLICKLTGHEMWMEEYPPGPVVSVCIRCGYREIRMPQIPEPVHGAEGGHGDFHCGFCSRWFHPPVDVQEPVLTHMHLIHGVQAANAQPAG
jgi:hypothetical protein